MTNYSNFVAMNAPKIEQSICEFLQEETIGEELTKSMIYSIKAGGKKFRPLLFLATLDLFDYSITQAEYNVASSLEMIHTYSLIHDDLPAMDDDDLRRGMPTNHIEFGEALAILAGDGLLTEAFHLLSLTDIEPKKLVNIMGILSASAGTKGMIAGQVEDIQAENRQASLEELQKIHEKKTGALIKSAVEMACIIADVNIFVQGKLEQYATSLGIAFQIRDDLLDVIGDETLIGKHTGSDEKLNKSTYVSLLGLSGAKEAFYEQCDKAQEALNQVKLELNQSINSLTLLDEILKELKEIA